MSVGVPVDPHHVEVESIGHRVVAEEGDHRPVGGEARPRLRVRPARDRLRPGKIDVGKPEVTQRPQSHYKVSEPLCSP